MKPHRDKRDIGTPYRVVSLSVPSWCPGQSPEMSHDVPVFNNQVRVFLTRKRISRNAGLWQPWQ